MKIAIVVPYFYPNTGGAENYALKIATRLSQIGNDVFVITSNKDNPKDYCEDEVMGIHVYRLPILFTISNTPINPVWYFQLKKIFSIEKPDLINAHTPLPFFADIAARSAGKTKFVLTVHAASLYKNKSPLYNFILKIYNATLYKGTLKRATHIGAVSEYVKLKLPAFAQPKCTLLYNFISKADISSIPVQRYDHRLVFIGSLAKTHAWKGLDLILEATALAHKVDPKIELYVLGDGDMLEAYKQEAKNLGLGKIVTFTGNITGTQKFDIIKSSKALLIYPTTENDAFPTVMLEAWACGTIVIGSNIGSLTLLLKNSHNGYLVEPQNPLALSEAILRATANKNPNDIIASGKKLINDKYNLESVSRRTNDLFLFLSSSERDKQ